MSALDDARKVFADWPHGAASDDVQELLDAIKKLADEHEELLGAHASLKSARRSRRKKDTETIERLTKQNAEFREQVYKLGVEILIEANK